MANEYALLAKWLQTTIGADTVALNALFPDLASRVYDSTVVQGAVFPYIVYTHLAPHDDLMLVGTRRVWASYDVELVVIGQNIPRSVLWPVAARLDALLHGNGGVVTGGQVVAFTRTRPGQDRVEYDGDAIYRYVVAGVFTARVQAT